jgi:hypothetical protein
MGSRDDEDTKCTIFVRTRDRERHAFKRAAQRCTDLPAKEAVMSSVKEPPRGRQGFDAAAPIG